MMPMNSPPMLTSTEPSLRVFGPRTRRSVPKVSRKYLCTRAISAGFTITSARGLAGPPTISDIGAHGITHCWGREHAAPHSEAGDTIGLEVDRARLADDELGD